MTPARYMMADVSWHPTSAVSLERFLFCHCAHHEVGAAAGRERDDEADRAGRKFLSEAMATERKENCQRSRSQNGTTCNHQIRFLSIPARLYAQSAVAYAAASQAWRDFKVIANHRRRTIGRRVELGGEWTSEAVRFWLLAARADLVNLALLLRRAGPSFEMHALQCKMAFDPISDIDRQICCDAQPASPRV